MFKPILAASALFLFCLTSFPSLGPVTVAEAGNQRLCPVMGFEINRELYTDYMDQRVYFCCPICPPEFKQTPDQYMTEMRKQGIVPEKTPA